MTSEEKARPILRGLSGQHLYGFLPGNDHKAAISHAASGYHGWGGGGQSQWGQVTRKGIGLYDSIEGTRDERNAVVLITWREVLGVIAKGCTDGRREAYEAAHDAWNEHHGRWPAWDPKRRTSRTHAEIIERQEEYRRVTDGIHETTGAIIKAGCSLEPVQPELF
jgi:hypothetical protein